MNWERVSRLRVWNNVTRWCCGVYSEGAGRWLPLAGIREREREEKGVAQ